MGQPAVIVRTDNLTNLKRGVIDGCFIYTLQRQASSAAFTISIFRAFFTISEPSAFNAAGSLSSLTDIIYDRTD